ncbi:MAG: WD40 repeat domain-containing protein [Cyanobacteria bacterium J06634_5]
MVDERSLDIITYNRNALNNLRRAIVLGQGQFSLILARVNYRKLQQVLLKELSGHLRLKTVHLKPSDLGLREALVAGTATLQARDQIQALTVTGLDEVTQLEILLKSANLGRDELPKSFRSPLVLWVNDTVLQHLNRYAADLKSFAATPIRFEYPVRSLIHVLIAQANDTFAQILNTDQGIVLSNRLPLTNRITEPLASQELSFAITQLEQQEQQVNNQQLADLLFLQGRNLHQQGDLPRARSYYENSLTYWQQHIEAGQSISAVEASDEMAINKALEESLIESADNAEIHDREDDKTDNNTPADETTQASSVETVELGAVDLGTVEVRAVDLKTDQEPADQEPADQEPVDQETHKHASSPLSAFDKQAVLLFHLGLWWRSHAVLNAKRENTESYQQDCQQAQQYFERSLAIFRQQQRPDRITRFILALAEVLQKQENWSELSAIAQEGISLHAKDPARLARDYGYLAEVAIARYKTDPQPDYLTEAQRFAQQALNITPTQAIAPSSLQRSLSQKSSSSQSIASKIALRYHRSCYLYLLALTQQLQEQPQNAIDSLTEALTYSNPRYDFSLHRRILSRLWHLYYDHRHYAKAFDIKLAQRRIENFFGLRAFIGASQIKQSATVDQQQQETDPTPEIAAEIEASGRTQDIEAIANRLAQPRYPIVVIHGQSGVGKSSIIRAGLIPTLSKLISEGRTTLPLFIDTYSDWLSQLQQTLTASADASAQDIITQLKRHTQSKYQQIVLIFDQFEDFFHQYPTIAERRILYSFLRDCLNLPYIKIVLSLREDFLHYLLEWDRSADLAIIENNILSKELRYYLGNFKPAAAENLVRQLTNAAGFSMEDGLITALVDDLAADTGEVRPIELQVVGAQLQRENITQLKQYQALGRSPKNQLLKNFLDTVIRDCGPENRIIAQSVLYLLSEGGSRPLKSHSEIAEALAFASLGSSFNEDSKEDSLHTDPQQLQLVLDILIGSGVVFEVPEVSGIRYQLVHEYLSSLVQQQPPTGLIEALQTERSRRELTEEQLKKALEAQSDSLVQTTLARQKTQAAEIKALISISRSLRLSGNGIESLSKAMRAAQQIRQGNGDAILGMQAALCLDAAVRDIREKNELTDHRNWVLAVHCSPVGRAPVINAGEQENGERIISASDDGTLKLWNGKGQLLRTLTGHHAGVLDVKFSPNGQYIASASLDHTIRLWTAAGDFMYAIDTVSASVTGISFSPTEPILAAAYSDTFVRLWAINTDRSLSATGAPNAQPQTSPVMILKGHEDWARAVAFSPDGKTIVTGSEDQTVRLWNRQGKLLRVITGHQGWVRAVAFSPDGKTILSAGDANTLRLWYADGRKKKTLYGHEDWVRTIAFSPDGQRIASGSDDQTVKIWGVEGTIQQTFNQRSSVHSVAWSADGRSVVSGGDDDSVHVWQLKGPPEPICKGHTGIVWSARWQRSQTEKGSENRTKNRTEKTLLSAGSDNTIKIWTGQRSANKLWTGEAQLVKSVVSHQRGVHSVDWSPTGEFFASASADHSVRIWTAKGEAVRSLTGHTDAVWQVSYSPDGNQLASVSSDRTLRLWTPQGTLLKTWTGHTDTIWHVSYSPDGQHLITASEDNTLRLWHHQKGLTQTITDPSGGIWCARFSPDGHFIASGGADGVIRLWSVNRQSASSPISSRHAVSIEPNPLMLQGHRDWIRSLSFSNQGDFLASGSDDGTVRLWSLLPETLAALSADNSDTVSQLLPPLTGHEGVVWDVDFDEDGQRLVTASADGSVRIWDLQLETLLEKGCQWLEDWLLARPELAQHLCKPRDY